MTAGVPRTRGGRNVITAGVLTPAVTHFLPPRAEQPARDELAGATERPARTDEAAAARTEAEWENASHAAGETS